MARSQENMAELIRKKNKKNQLVSRADLHLHSHYSGDAFSSPKAILKVAKKRGLDVIAITDHNTIVGALEAREMADNFGLEVIIGEEIDTQEGDLLALFIKERISPGQKISAAVKEIKRQGGLAIIPHPNNWLLEGVSLKDITMIYRELNGIELINGSWPGKIGREASRKMNESVFKLATTGGSDAHLAIQVGSAYTFFPGRSKEDLYQAIKEKKSWPGGGQWSWSGRLLWTLNSFRIIWQQPKRIVIMVKIIFKKISRKRHA